MKIESTRTVALTLKLSAQEAAVIADGLWLVQYLRSRSAEATVGVQNLIATMDERALEVSNGAVVDMWDTLTAAMDE